MFSHISKQLNWRSKGFSHVPSGSLGLKSFFLGNIGSGSGANNHIDFDGNDIVLNGEFTISFYGYLSDQITSGGRSGICCNQLYYGAGAGGGRISFFENNQISFNENSASYITFAHTANFEDTSSHIELKRNASNLITVYQNGVSKGSGTLAGTFYINRVMGNPDNSSWTGYYGGMRNFKIYSRELTSEESTTNRNNGHVSTDCELWYKMNERSGTTVTDYSGNGRHGTIENHDTTTFFQTAKSMTNLVSNGGFSAWTAGDLDWWTDVPTGDVNNYIVQSNGMVRIITDGGSTITGFNRPNTNTVGKRYKVILAVHAVASGGAYIYNASGNVSPNYTTIGQKVWDFTATGTSVNVYRITGAPAEDVTIANIQMFEL